MGDIKINPYQHPSGQISSYWPLTLDPMHPYSFWESVFTKEECEKIIDIGNQNLIEGSTIGNTNLRSSSIHWVFPENQNQWIFEKLNLIVQNINSQYFHFDLSGFAEGLQFTKYTAPDGEYRKHTDRLFNIITRKLSITVQLSDPEDYEGGEFLLYNEESPVILPKKQGTVLVFPSFTLHEVKKVNSGTRYSLVAWITGPAFK
jgi:PKHD-type hydroxylase